MDLVIDANILFSFLIKNGKNVNINLDTTMQLFCPEFLLEEFFKYRDYILTKTHRSIDDFNKLYTILTNKISPIPFQKISPFMNQAEQLSPDPKDTVYISSALSINANLWSNDKKLKDNQSIVKVFSTSDLVNEFILGPHRKEK